MSSSSRWQTEISFADSSHSIKRQDLGLSIAECQSKGREIEKRLYEQSNTRAEYDAACESHYRQNDDNESEEENLIVSETRNSVSIGRYEKSYHHRDGLFSTIYKVEVVQDGDKFNDRLESPIRFVALKVTNPSTMTAPHDSLREARILRDFHHASVIPLLDTFNIAGGLFVLVFPYMRFDLSQLLLRKRTNINQNRSHLLCLFQALAFLHSNGIIHRDVKPSNILLRSRDGPAFLADFGTAWSPLDIAGEPADHKITDVGTTFYRPPELLFGYKSYGCHLDLWAAGCVVAEVAGIDGHPLFEAGDLGSELALIKSIFKKLGTPTLREWPEAELFPDWGKMEFVHFPPKSWLEIMPDAPPNARDLISRLVRFESSQRLSAENVLEHPYFTS